jgi:hypothetical protein
MPFLATVVGSAGFFEPFGLEAIERDARTEEKGEDQGAAESGDRR